MAEDAPRTASSADAHQESLRWRSSYRYDIPSGVVVFLVAVPLCLGIALASNAPLFSGLLSGIIGGLVIPWISRSPLSVAGPAAGLTAIVLMGIDKLGSFEAFMVATFLGGLVQIGLGAIRAGGLASLVPLSVIRGMLAAIGLIVIFKELPHAIGYDIEAMGVESFIAPEGRNTFSLMLDALAQIEWGAFVISMISLLLLAAWPKTPMGRVNWLPGALMVVFLGVGLNALFHNMAPALSLAESHLVRLPDIAGPAAFVGNLRTPDFSVLTNPAIYTVAVTVGLVASMESLLCVEAVDRLDPFKRHSPMSRELVAQGVGNSISGLIGGLPITSVIVRSSTNVASGGRTRLAAIVHGVLLLSSVMFATQLLSLIPLAALAAILLQVGYKLAHPRLMMRMYRSGWEQFVPFAVTIVAILFTDLLRGVIVGLVVGMIFTLRHTAAGAYTVIRGAGTFTIRFNKDQTFVHKAALNNVLREIPDDAKVIFDAKRVEYLDLDIKETINEFRSVASSRGIEVEIRGLETDDHGNAVARRPADAGVVRTRPDEDRASSESAAAS